MSKAPLSHLQKAAQAVSSSKTRQETINTLSNAFDLFSKETQRLETAYDEVKKQFKTLNLELEETNQKLQVKVLELDIVTYYLNSILSNISQGILFIDLNGTVTTYNSAAEKLLGPERNKVLFNSFWENFTDDQFGFSMRETLSDHISPANAFAILKGTSHESQKYVEIDTTFVTKEINGVRQPAEKTAIDTTQGLIVLLRDITELRRLESLAARNDRMKELGEMAAMVAHEIRNPLGGIKGFAALLQRDLIEQPELQRLATYIIEGTDSLNRLVNNVLDYSRPVQLKLEMTNLVVLMESLILHLNADEGVDPRIELRCKSTVEQLYVLADSQSLKSALLNLMSNAIKAMPEGGELWVNVDATAQEAILKVSDTGIGIPAENLNKIFSPFFTTRPDGHGFGLTEVHKIVQAHGGQIDVESEVGNGTIFTIRLPIRKEAKN